MLNQVAKIKGNRKCLKAEFDLFELEKPFIV